MNRYITILIFTFLLLGCEIMTPPMKIETQNKTSVKQKLDSRNSTIEKPKKMSLPEEFREAKKLRPIEKNVPQRCQEWSDGCNVCSRAEKNQASCTLYSCEIKSPFSCLKWQ